MTTGLTPDQGLAGITGQPTRFGVQTVHPNRGPAGRLNVLYEVQKIPQRLSMVLSGDEISDRPAVGLDLPVQSPPNVTTPRLEAVLAGHVGHLVCEDRRQEDVINCYTFV